MTSNERVSENAAAFLCVLEFSLADEQAILRELKQSWSQYSEAELASYDNYSVLVQVIMAISGQTELVEIQEALAETVHEWIRESDPSDWVVKLIKAQMQKANQISQYTVEETKPKLIDA